MEGLPGHRWQSRKQEGDGLVCDIIWESETAPGLKKWKRYKKTERVQLFKERTRRKRNQEGVCTGRSMQTRGDNVGKQQKARKVKEGAIEDSLHTSFFLEAVR